MAGDLATVEDVESVWRPTPTDQLPLVQGLIGKASNIVRHSFPSVDDRVAEDPVFADVVATIVANMAIRVLANPEGYKSQTVGPFSVTQEVNNARLWLTDAEIALLAPPTSTQFRAYTVPLS